jgi:quinol monooxygenase YgiN
MASIILAGTIRVPADKMAAFRPPVAAMVAASAAEPGCIAYAQSESVSDPGLIHIFEHFEDEAALAFHRASPHMAAWRAIWPQFDVGGRDMSSYDVSDYRKI